MARFALLALATAAALVNGYSFKKPCVLDRDICGWALQSDYGYDNEFLSAATGAANQDVGSGTVIFDSIYNCYPNGDVVWSVWCGGGGKCDKQAGASSHAYCKGEPVETGREPPRYDDSNPWEEEENWEEEPWNDDPFWDDPTVVEIEVPWSEDPYYQPDEPWYP
ncbi:hypothetical protein B0T14DRAFT_497727 [Immersiella caudata]|uniref:Uncharacterized protein n=1 Tax=Immersiella caudata TaxID=314043 RepID=A0AA40BWQ0_9PEZI|nr:hypothetical protein B0T14DRAFT_497727 [Immersiella caudata]